MTGDSKDQALHALVANVQGEPTGPLIAFSDAAKEIADALKIPNEAASMTLYGLCATGYVRWTDISGVIVEEGDLTVANFSDSQHSWSLMTSAPTLLIGRLSRNLSGEITLSQFCFLKVTTRLATLSGNRSAILSVTSATAG
jgi:hypothetical protein